MFRKLHFTAAIAATAILAGTASAAPITINLDYDQYGHNQNDEGRCAATAMMNSFEFLANTYPTVYGGTALTTGDPASPDSPIRQLDDVMGGNGCGVTRQEAWEGKNEWFDTYAPNTTTLEGMTDEDFSGWADNEGLIAGIPTAEWLLGELQDGEDVEIRLAGALHWVTLIGITVDEGLALSIRYIDPNCVNGTSNATPGPMDVAITYNGGYMQFGWQNGDGQVCSGPSVDAQITTAFSESPIPEPGTFVLLGMGTAAAIIRRRKTRTSIFAAD